MVAGILKSGNIYIWHKDSSTTWMIQGIPDFIPIISSSSTKETNPPYGGTFFGISKNVIPEQKHDVSLYIDDFCYRVIITVRNQFYIWFANLPAPWKYQDLSSGGDLEGTWCAMLYPSDIPEPSVDCKNLTTDVYFNSITVSKFILLMLNMF